MTHNLIFFSPSFHCKHLWHLQPQKVHHQVYSPVILMVTLCHRLEKVQEVVVVLGTTEPEGGVLGGEEEQSVVILCPVTHRIEKCLLTNGHKKTTSKPLSMKSSSIASRCQMGTCSLL